MPEPTVVRSPSRFSSVTAAVRVPTPRTPSQGRPSPVTAPFRKRKASREVRASVLGTTTTRVPPLSSRAVTSGSRSIRAIRVRAAARAETGCPTPVGTCVMRSAATEANSSGPVAVRRASTSAGSAARRSRSAGVRRARAALRSVADRPGSRAASVRTGSAVTSGAVRNAWARPVSSARRPGRSPSATPSSRQVRSWRARVSASRAAVSSTSLSRTARDAGAPAGRAAR